jgi:hypothetical protein
MNRLVEVTLAIIFALIVVSCAAIAQQKAQPPRPDDLQFHNLQILPQNITHDELITTMRRFAQALGVKCNHCHAPLPGDPSKFDFPSDAKPQKASARIMIKMTGRINREYIPLIEEAYTTVSCWTCHRGRTQPDIVPSLPPEEAH